MTTSISVPSGNLAPLTYAWLALVALTLISLGLGVRFQPFAGGFWLGAGLSGVRTGALTRSSFDARIIRDFKVLARMRWPENSRA